MNTFGRIFKISIFGESHGTCVGITIDGCPPGIPIEIEDFTTDLLKRKSGAKGTTPRIEGDIPKILSGVFNNFSTGAPITIITENLNIKSSDYSDFIDIPRPGHADFTSQIKYKGFQDYRGGGHFSARLTFGLVVAGVIAKKLIQPIEIKANLIEAGGNKNIEVAIEKAISENDSIGGIIECCAKNINVGLGEPYFDSVESVLAHLLFSIPAVKGVEFGSGFGAAKMKGTENNDLFANINGSTNTNNAGGINGGITNGNNLIFRIVIKPTSSTPKIQKTMNFKTNEIVDFEVKGRHDVCVALRAPVIVEAVTAIVLADFHLISRTY